VASEHLESIQKIKSPLAERILALGRIEADFHIGSLRRIADRVYTPWSVARSASCRYSTRSKLKVDLLMAPSESAGEDIAVRRRRMRYRAWHRGTKEMDLVLGPYADAHLEQLGTPELDVLEHLMDEQDTDLLEWVMGQTEPPGHVDRLLLDHIVRFRLKAAQ
jgi:antitoxin CptB